MIQIILTLIIGFQKVASDTQTIGISFNSATSMLVKKGLNNLIN